MRHRLLSDDVVPLQRNEVGSPYYFISAFKCKTSALKAKTPAYRRVDKPTLTPLDTSQGRLPATLKPPGCQWSASPVKYLTRQKRPTTNPVEFIK
jgi:hypothetical protein